MHFRRAAYWAIQIVMESKALGDEIINRGKLTTERSRFEKFRAGYLPRVGDPVLKSVKVAVADVQLKQGLFGIKVRILPPTVDFIDKPTMKTPPPSVAPTPTVQAPVAEAVEVETEKEEPIGNPAQARDETRNTLLIEARNRLVRVPKDNTLFVATLPTGEIIPVQGPALKYRPEDRVKKGLARW